MAKKKSTTEQNDKRREREHLSLDEKYTWRYQLRRLPWLLLFPLGLAIPALVRNSPDKVENIYSRAVYPVIARVIGFISSLVPISIAELLIVGFGSVIILVLLIRIIKMLFGKLVHRKKNRIRLFSFLITLLITAGALLNSFYLLWGLNHFRQPVSNLMKLEVHARSRDELALACEKLAAEAAEIRKNCSEDEDGVFKLNRTESLKSVRDAYKALGENNELFENTVYPTKSVLLSEMLSRLNIAGIYIPYTEEANVNANQPDLFFAAGAAHETAHYFGFAREDEADFIAYLVSAYSDDPGVRYSTVMLALNYCAIALDGCDHERFAKIVKEYYSEEMVRDILDYNKYYDVYADKPEAKANETVNDAYLKYNGQSDGVNSYGNMVDLLLAFLALEEN